MNLDPVYLIPTFLPGRLLLGRGGMADYLELARFHYRGRTPACFAEVWGIRFQRHAGADQVVAVAALAHPIPALRVRERALGIEALDAAAKLAFLNASLRTIARVAVHPTFRSLGLARILVRCLIHHSPVRYLEALAVMGRVHPFFELAGMRAHPPDPVPAHLPPPPWYYLFDRARMRLQWTLRPLQRTVRRSNTCTLFPAGSTSSSDSDPGTSPR